MNMMQLLPIAAVILVVTNGARGYSTSDAIINARSASRRSISTSFTKLNAGKSMYRVIDTL